MKFYIKGINCKACASFIEKTLKDEKEIIQYNFSYINKELEINCSIETLKKIENKLKKHGYYLVKDEKEIKKEVNYKKRNLILSIMLFIPLFYLNMSHMLYIPIPSFLDLHKSAITNLSIQLTIATLLSIINYKYFINGFKNLFKSPNMDSLIAISTTSSIIFGIYNFIMLIITNDKSYINNVYFESAAMILVFISIGKYLEDIAINKSKKEFNEIKKENNKKARVIKNNKEEEILKENVTLDDILIVKSGDEIPLDGVIIEGLGYVDQSSFTGESKLIEKQINNTVLAGTYLKEGYFKVKPTALYKDSKYKNILNKVEEMAKTKLKIERVVDKISFYFVYFVITISIITFLINYLILKNINTSINNAISVLVVACPCALGLATPICTMIASILSYKNKILIKDINQLEIGSKINHIIFDKTGTLTKSNFQIEYLDLEYKDIIYNLEKLSNHPIAKSITNYLKDKNIKDLEIKDFKEIKGIGIEGIIDNKEIKLGNYKLLNKNKSKDLYLIINNELKTTIKLKSEIKENTKELIDDLNKKYETYLVTGDNKEKALEIKNELNIKNVYYETLPEEKLKIIKEIKKDKKNHCLMIGDGVNDSLALMEADVSITIKDSSDLAKNSSNVIILNDDLSNIGFFLKLSKRTLRTMKINLFFAFFYNLIAIIIATGALSYFKVTLNPMISSILMSISSLFVVLNSETLFLINKKEKYMQIKVEGMHCEHCKKTVEEKFKSIGINAKVNLKKKLVKIDLKEVIEEDKIKEIINDLGFKYIKIVK